VDKPGEGRAGRLRAWITGARQYQERFKRRRWVAFALASLRRFDQIDGKHLAIVIAANLFIAVIPLIIIGYAIAEGFNPRHGFGVVIATNLHLSGGTAQIVKDTFTTASSGKITAVIVTVISLLITGLDISAAAQTAYARAFAMTPLRGPQKYLRGGAWLVLLLAGTGAGLTLRSVTAGRPAWLVLIAWLVWIAIEFGFFIITPRLLLDLPFAWRDLVPGAAVCTGAAIAVHAVAAFLLRYWFGFYGHGYGGFGIALALISFTGIIASFWVWIAAVMGVYWERKAGPAAVAEMEKLSADISAP
jgi:uncharacterized BrkB/YihY/UPF0761 family membrane protein